MRHQEAKALVWKATSRHLWETHPVAPTPSGRLAKAQQALFWLARKLGWDGKGEAQTIKIDYTEIPIDMTDVVLAVDKQIHDLFQDVDRRPKHIYMGAKNFREAMHAQGKQGGYGPFVADGMHLEAKFACPGGGYRMFDIPVTIVPNLDGVLVVPEIER